MDASKLKALSKKDKLAILDALEVKAERERDRKDNYVPNAGQLPVHISTKRTRVVFSGNGAGKSCMGVQEIMASVNGYNPWTKEHTPVPSTNIIVLDRPEKVDEVVMPELRKWFKIKPEQLHKRGRPYISKIIFDNGSEITFMFADQEPMAFESVQVTGLVWFDEPPPRHCYVGLRRAGRVKGRQARYLITGTPIGGTGSWLRTDLYEPWAKGEAPEVECFRFGTRVNEKNLSEGYIQSFSSVLTEKEKQVRLEGAFHDIDGLALAHLFDRGKHLLPASEYRWPPHYPVIVAIDVAMAKPHVALMMGITKDNQYVVLKELSYKGTAPEFAERFKIWAAGYNIVDIIADSLGSSELSGGDGRLSFIASLNKHGVKCRATTYAEKDDSAWISMIREVLFIPEEPDNFGNRTPRLRVLSNCTGLIADIEQAAWKKQRLSDEYLPKIDISKLDRLAALKYCLAAQPTHDKGRERVIRSRNGVGLRQTDRTLNQLKK